MKSTIFIFILIIGIGIVLYKPLQSSKLAKLDSFAKCLAEKDITMYGADWCSHCQNQKKIFGSSFQYVPYMECPDQPKLCIDKEIKGYPTWVFPGGRKIEGEQDLLWLSNESGCLLP